MTELTQGQRESLAMRTRHGESTRSLTSLEHRAWQSMNQRCYNKNHNSYKNYGAKGIVVCARWRGRRGFQNFLEDMGRKPSSEHSLERKRGELGYFKENCVWATRTEQNNNTSRNAFLTLEGRTQTIAQWARERRLSYTTLCKRLVLGWTVERALLTPPNQAYARSR